MTMEFADSTTSDKLTLQKQAKLRSRSSFGLRMSLTADALSSFFSYPFSNSTVVSKVPSEVASPEESPRGFQGIVPVITTTPVSPQLQEQPTSTNSLSPSSTSSSTSNIITPITMANTVRNQYPSGETHLQPPNSEPNKKPKNRKQRSVSCPDRYAQDPIIQAMLANRTVDDVAPEFEEERRKRMYNMLRYSKQYKKMQVQRANMTWQDEVTSAGSLPTLPSDLSGLGLTESLNSLDTSAPANLISTQPSQGGLFAMDQLDQALSEFNSVPTSPKGSLPPPLTRTSTVLRSEWDSLSPLSPSTIDDGRRTVSFDEKVVVIADGQGVGAIAQVLELHDEPEDVDLQESEEDRPSSPPPLSPLSPLDPELANDPEMASCNLINERLIAAAKRSPSLPPLPVRKRRWSQSPPIGEKFTKLLAGLGLLKQK